MSSQYPHLMPSAEPAPVDAVISTKLAEPRDRRVTAFMAGLSFIIFVAAAPFARVPLSPLPAFIPAYEAALVFIDVITAVLLFGQFTQRASAALLFLAAGYMFDGLMIVPHALTFPGVMSPAGWLGAGEHTTAWLYMFWHGGFPLFVIAYSSFNRLSPPQIAYGLERKFAYAAIGGTLGLVVALTLLATAGHDVLPPLMVGHTNAIGQKIAALTVWGLTGAALVTLLFTRPYSVLDLWLIVVMVAWLADIGLSAVFDAARYDLGFYAGRLYGLLAASIVLVGILIETAGLQRKLASASAQLNELNRTLAQRVDERTAELRLAQKKIQEQMERAEAVLEATPDAVVIVNQIGLITIVNARAEEIFGYSRKELLGQPIEMLIPDQFRAAHIAHRGVYQLAPTAIYRMGAGRDLTACRSDGHEFAVNVNLSPLSTPDGLLIISAIRDVTERHHAEAQLRQAQKMEAIGNLTGGLAHDFNNLLAIMIGNLDLLREVQNDDADVAELTQGALDAALRGADLTRRLLAFARQQPLQPKLIDVNELVSAITKLLTRTLGEEIEVTLDLAADAWRILVDPAQLEASLVNLATNSRDAMPHGGQLRIATENRHLDAAYTAQHDEVVVGDYVMVEVSDTGAGMPPEIASRIFEPFFTTKERGKGTGLGLAMVFGFVRQSRGHINVYSEPGRGTTFRLYLPRSADDTGSLLRNEVTNPLVRGGGERILVVEDNALLRRIVVRQLVELDYRVLEAENAATALGLLAKERVDLVITDVVMPGGSDGIELARQVQQHWPMVKVVFTSGFPESQIDSRIHPLPNDALLLTKPYRKDELAAIVRNSLRGAWSCCANGSDARGH